jgi:DNA topoisomerase-1
MPTKLVIVESPAKARTIAGFLGPEFTVESSIGHIRDLPESASEIPAKQRDLKWARLGVDVDNDFAPLYVVPGDKKKQVTKLRKALATADELILATDEDREGESIAWHLFEVLKPKVPVKRMVFHEITRAAIEDALSQTRDIDDRLVDAQEARRILDRLFGFEVSPVLWRKIRPRLSAGRVQSPAIRIIVERERERMRFNAAGYWDLAADFSAAGDEFAARLVAVDETRVATGKDFDESGSVAPGKSVLVLDEPAATELAAGLRNAEFDVRSVERKPYRRSPYPPFRTSTLQQESGRKLRFAASRTMRAAQRLYENGFITYMRTDSTTLAEAAIASARSLVAELYGADYLPDRARTYAKKVRNAQEAHEAIRPAGDRFTPIETVRSEFGEGSDEARVYELIWKRTVASQMKDATGHSLQVRLGATAADGRDTLFAASGKTIAFPGFLRAYVEGSDDPDADLEDQERPLPDMAEGEHVDLVSLNADGHETKPPSRFTEAALVKRLEELGIGRPSTYASIIQTIQDRGYVLKRGTALVPTFVAFATVGLLEDHFPDLVDYAFTARMEDDLDAISRGEAEATPWLGGFYFGNDHPGLKAMVSAERLEEIDPRLVNSIPVGADPDGVEIVARVGKYGPYLQRGDDSASIPEDIAPDEITVDRAIELLSQPDGDRTLGIDPETDLPVLARAGRFGPYVQLGEAGEGKGKPKTASLFKSMSLETVTLEDALRLLTQPRVVGTDPESGEDITARNGRYGPYVKRGKETRNLEEEEQIFTLTLDEALALLAQPKQRRGRSTAPLVELGDDPNSGKPVVVKDGRWGPYVTDGETNASLRGSDSVDSIDLERAVELLAERRARGPAKKRRKSG